MKHRWAIILAAAALLGAAPPLGAAPLATQPIERSDGWWQARHTAKLEEARDRPVDLVFLGDSITQQWEKPAYRPVWQHFYGDRNALNLGFVGDATSHLLWRIEHGELRGLHPRAVVILIGANNLGRLHWPEPDDVAGIEAVVDATRRLLPDAKILLLGVLPSDRGAWVLQTTAAINRALAARYAHGAVANVSFLDLSAEFLRPDGSVDDAKFIDPTMTPPHPALHPSPEAAATMAAAMEPALAAMLGDRDHTR
jgi:lysophospholipase L1-like esterase